MYVLLIGLSVFNRSVSYGSEATSSHGIENSSVYVGDDFFSRL